MDWLQVAQRNAAELTRRQVSEADAERMIVEPLLQWLGFDVYDLDQVQQQFPVTGAGRKVGQGLADYALKVAGTVHAFVETKAIKGGGPDLGTHDEDIQQLQNYCNQFAQRPRWGALTNGKLWLIYDSQAQAVFRDRLVLRADVHADPELILALSPSNRDALTEYADRLALARQHPGFLGESARKEALSRLRNHLLPQLKRQALAAAPPGALATAEATPPTGEATSPGTTPPVTQPPVGPAAELRASHSNPPPGGAEPTVLVFRGARSDVNAWSRVLVIIAEYVAGRGALPPDWRPQWSKRVVVSARREEMKVMKSPKQLAHGAWVETNWSAQHCVRLAGDLLAAVGEAPDGFEVLYRLRT